MGTENFLQSKQYATNNLFLDKWKQMNIKKVTFLNLSIKQNFEE